MRALILYYVAAVLEIAGCYTFWAALRQGRSPWLMLAGLGALAGFAFTLTRVESGYAGRAFAASGGMYIVSSLLWVRLVEGGRPDRWDLTGAGLCLPGRSVLVRGRPCAL